MILRIDRKLLKFHRLSRIDSENRHLAPNPSRTELSAKPARLGGQEPRVPGGWHASSTPQGLKSGVDVSTAKNLWPAAPTARVPMKRDFGNLPCFPVRYGEVIEKRMRPVCTFPGRSGRRTERVMGQVSLRCICAPKRTVSAGYNFDYAYVRGSTSFCPICRHDLRAANTGLSCKSDHSFDFARQGYVNLIHNKPSVRIR